MLTILVDSMSQPGVFCAWNPFFWLDRNTFICCRAFLLFWFLIEKGRFWSYSFKK